MYVDYKTVIIFALAQGTYYSNQLILDFFGRRKIDHLHSLLWRSETEFINALCMHNLIAPLMPLYHVKF